MIGVVRHLEGWKLAGLCAGHADPDLWFADDPAGLGAAKSLCAACPVAVTCLDDALARGETVGIWGGLDPGERREAAARLGLVVPEPWHGTPAGAKAHGCHCRPCLDAHARDLAEYRSRRRWAARPATRPGSVIYVIGKPSGRGLHRVYPGQLYLPIGAAS